MSEDPLRQFYRQTKNLPIRVEITPGDLLGDGSMRRWRISISDSGCGIGLEDLSSLQVIGSSSRNKAKQRRIDSMPEFLRPTGSFGLGFQSVFLDTNEVTIKTEHLTTGERREIVAVRSSKALRRGLEQEDRRSGLYVRKLSRTNVNAGSFGTTMSFSVDRPSSYGRERSDPVLDESSEPTATAWLREISQICAALPVPVVVNGQAIASEAAEDAFAYFDRSNAIRITFDLRGIGREEPMAQLYRGAAVQRSTVRGHLLPLSADLYYGRASSIVQVSRTSFTSLGQQEYQQRLEASLPAAIERYIQHLQVVPSGDPDALGRASLMARAVYRSVNAGEHWRSLRLPLRIEEGGTQTPVTLAEFVEAEEVTFLVVSNRGFSRGLRKLYDLRPGMYLLPATGRSEVAALVRENFAEVCHERTIGPIYFEYFPSYFDLFVARKKVTGAPRLGLEAFEFSSLPLVPGRARIPCLDEFSELKDSEDSYTEFSPVGTMLSPFIAEGDVMGPSFTLTLDNVEQYVRYVSRKAASTVGSSAQAQAQVARKLQGFLIMLDGIYAKYSFVSRNYDLKRIAAQLQVF